MEEGFEGGEDHLPLSQAQAWPHIRYPEAQEVTGRVRLPHLGRALRETHLEFAHSEQTVGTAPARRERALDFSSKSSDLGFHLF